MFGQENFVQREYSFAQKGGWQSRREEKEGNESNKVNQNIN